MFFIESRNLGCIDNVGDNRVNMASLQIGNYQKSGELFSFDSELLRTHIALIGTNGSGKTVAAKTLIEEATMAGIPSLLIDPQGDLGRLTILADPKTVLDNGGDAKRAKQYAEMAEVRIWTPTKNKGLPRFSPVSRNGRPREIG